MNLPADINLETLPKTAEMLPPALDAAPPDLLETGLTVALHRIARGFGQRHGIECAVPPGIELLWRPAANSAALIWIVEEALANAVPHAAASRVDIILGFELGHYLLTVRDDGKGFRATRWAAAQRGSPACGSMPWRSSHNLTSPAHLGAAPVLRCASRPRAGATKSSSLLKSSDASI